MLRAHYLKHFFKVIFLSLIITIILFNIALPVSASIYFSNDQYKVLEDINKLRSKMGLSTVELDEALTRAANDHSIYLFANNVIEHEQKNSLYKTNRYFYDRIDQYANEEYYRAYQWSMIAEDVAYRSPKYAVQDLVEAPYHRYPIIHPQLTHIGVGTIGFHNTVLTFGVKETFDYVQQPLLYPYNNEKDVLLSQKVYENPDPFVDTPMTQEEAGYVLSIFTGKPVNSTSLSISLYDENKNPVQFIVTSLTPNEGSDFWLVIPKEQFKPSTTYTFQVNGSISTFTTMTRNQFDEWNTERESSYEPYNSNKEKFDKAIAILKNPELYPNTNDEIKTDNNEITKNNLPQTFEKLGYNINHVGIYFNDHYLELNPTAHIKNNRTYIPLRGLLEYLDATINYDDVTKEIMIVQNDNWIKLKPHSDTVIIFDGESTTSKVIDVTPFIENGKTFVPLRFLTEILGAEVVWDQNSYTVGISY